MKSSKLSSVAVATLFIAVSARAAHVDMTDPRRALGREDDVRVDAQLIEETVSSGSPVGVMYQIQNLTSQPIAVADKLCDITYDSDSRTITLTVGSEVPNGGQMPHLTVIGPGEKKTLTTGAVLHVTAPSVRSPFVSVPQQVEIHVNFLRDVTPFHVLIEEQGKSAAGAMLTDQQFDQWLQSNDTILLNAIPVRFNAVPRSSPADASENHDSASSL